LCAGGEDVLYNKFSVASSTPRASPASEKNPHCVVAVTDYWKLSECTDEHRVVCQSGWLSHKM